MLVAGVLVAALALTGCVGSVPEDGPPSTAGATSPASSAVDLRAFVPRGTEGSGVSIRLQFPDGLVAGSVGTMDYLQNIALPPVQCAPFEIELREAGVSTLQIDGALEVVVRGEGGSTVAPAFIVPGDPVQAAFASADVLTETSLEDSDLTELEGFTLASFYPNTPEDWERFSGRVLDSAEVQLDQPC